MHGYVCVSVCVSVCACCVCVLVHVCDGSIVRVAKVLLLIGLCFFSSGPCKANTTGGICVSVLCEDRMAGKGRSEPSRSFRLCTV